MGTSHQLGLAIALAIAFGATSAVATSVTIEGPLGVGTTVTVPEESLPTPVRGLAAPALDLLRATQVSASAGSMAGVDVNKPTTEAAAGGTGETTTAQPERGAPAATAGSENSAGVGAGIATRLGAVTWSLLLLGCLLILLIVGLVWALARRRKRAQTPPTPLTLEASARQFAQQGREAAQRSQFTQAIAWFDAALKIEPNVGPLHLSRGLCLESLERYKEAHDAFGRAASCRPASALAFYHYARSFLWMGMHLEALPRLQLAIASDPRLAQRARTDDAFRPLADHPLFVDIVRDRPGGTA